MDVKTQSLEKAFDEVFEEISKAAIEQNAEKYGDGSVAVTLTERTMNSMKPVLEVFFKQGIAYGEAYKAAINSSEN